MTMDMDGSGKPGREKKTYGVYQRVERASQRRTVRRKGRRRMEQFGKKQLAWFFARVREAMKCHPMEEWLCPMKYFIDSANSLTRKAFLRWYGVVFQLQNPMYVEGNDYPYITKLHTYDRISMPYYRTFWKHLHDLSSRA